MRISFEVRTVSAKKTDIKVPLYVRIVDGRTFHQAVRTRTLIAPSLWDAKNECVRSRALCSPGEKEKINADVDSMRVYLSSRYSDARKMSGTDFNNWLSREVNLFYSKGETEPETLKVTKLSFDELFDSFLRDRKLGEGRKRHYDVLRRMILRYESYVKYSRGRIRYSLDVSRVDKSQIEEIYDYIENEYEYVERFPEILEDHPEARQIKPRGENYMSGVFKELRAFFNWAYKNKYVDNFPFVGFLMPSERYGSPIFLTLEDVMQIYNTQMSTPALAVQKDVFIFQCNVGCRVGDLLRLKKADVINGAIEYIPTKTIKESARTVVVPLNKVAQEIVDRYAKLPGDQLLPFVSAVNYNEDIKEIFKQSGITYLVTELDTVTRTEKKIHINEIASSHMARRTFIGNIYKLVKDPNLVSALTGHVEGSRAFSRYRTIDIDMKKDLVKILEG